MIIVSIISENIFLFSCLLRVNFFRASYSVFFMASTKSSVAKTQMYVQKYNIGIRVTVTPLCSSHPPALLLKMQK